MLTYLLVALYAYMPVAVMSTDTMASPAFYVALVLCLGAACWRPRVSAGKVLAEYRTFLCWYAIPLLAVLASCAVHRHWAGVSVEAGLRTSVGMLILLLGLRQVRPHLLRQTVWGVYAAALFATGYVMYLAYPSWATRPITTIYNAVSYGNLLLLLAVISLYSLRWRLTPLPSWLEKTIKLVVTAAAVAGFMLTQTRTGWLAVPVFAVLGVAMTIGFRHPWRAVGVLVAIGVIAVALGASSPSLRGRVEQGYQETMQCYDTARPVDDSICIRFQLWRAAWHAFSHNPAFGLGDHGLFRDWMQHRALPDGVVSKYVADDFGEPHDDMLQALSSFGIPGGVGLLILYFAPAWLFLKRLNQRYSRQTRAAAAMGAAVCLGFAVFGVTELMFRGIRTVGFYTMLVALFLVLSEPDGEAAA